MTKLSTTTQSLSSSNPHGEASTLNRAGLLAFISNLRATSYWQPITVLSQAKSFGLLDQIAGAADAAAAALEPVGRKVLTDRLTLLGMTMLHGKAADEQAAWLHETARLLQAYPQAILFDAIDACVTEPGRVFAPTVGEIIGKAATPLRDAEVEAAHLRELAIMLADGVEIPDYQPFVATPFAQPDEPKEYCSAEDARAIMQEFGVGRSLGGVTAALGSDKPKSRADYIAQGKVPPPRDPEPIYV